MEKKKKNLIFYIGIFVALFIGASAVTRSLQNDTFFTILLGQDILKNGIRYDEFLTRNTTFTFYNVRWLFDILIATIYNNLGFDGIYLFTVSIASIISLLLYLIISKYTKKPVLAIMLAFISIYVMSSTLTARAQILSNIIFILQFYCSQELLKTNKKRYYVILLILPILLVNIHGSVFPTYFIFYLPIIAEYLIGTIFTQLAPKLQRLSFYNYDHYKPLMIIIVISFFEGLINPNGLYPYYMMFATALGYSSKIINEMQPISVKYIIPVALLLTSFFCYPKKQKANTAFLILGITIMTIVSIRSMMYFFTICTLALCDLLAELLDLIHKNTFQDFTPKHITIISVFIIIVIIIGCTYSIINNYNAPLLNPYFYPTEAIDYLLEEVDLDNEILFNDFNAGSFLEFHGIKTFLDSRAEVFERPINDTDLLRDFGEAYHNGDTKDYKEFLRKYKFTIALIKKNSVLYRNCKNDIDIPNSAIESLYEDDVFVIYRIHQDKL